MLRKQLLLSKVVFLVTISLSCQNKDDFYFEKLIDFLYVNYPDFIPRLLSYNGTRFNSAVAITNSTVYDGFVMQNKLSNGEYHLYVANAFKQQYRNGMTRSSTRVHNTMFKCNRAVHYCHGNPAYCRYHEGEVGTRFIVFAGHDGPLRPESIPDRGVGCWVPKNESCLYMHGCEAPEKNIFRDGTRCKVIDQDDVETTDMAAFIVDKISEITGKRPHLIVSRIHRKKLDVNREIGMGTFYVEESVQVYNDVHDFMKRAKDSFNGEWGIILDIHGNEKPEQWTQLGYDVKKYQFDKNEFHPADSSLGNLAAHVNVTIDSLLRGENSLGHYIEELGIKSIPSPSNPRPKGNSYLTGGYITRLHGSKNGGNIDAIQIEIPVADRDDQEKEESYLTKLSRAIVTFVEVNYDNRGLALHKTANETSKS